MVRRDLFEYQSRSRGGRVMPDEAGCAVWAGITRLNVAGCGWTTVAICSLRLPLGLPGHPAKPLD